MSLGTTGGKTAGRGHPMANEARIRAAEIVKKWNSVKGTEFDVSFPKSADQAVVRVVVDAIRGEMYDVADALNAAEERLKEAAVLISRLLNSDMPVEPEEWKEQDDARQDAAAFLKELKP